MNRHLVTAFLRRISFVLPSLVALALSTPAHAKTAPAALTWSLAQYDFGSVAVGQEGSQTFTLSNTGGSSSGTIAVTETGSSAFVITANGCTGKALGPSKSCNVTVEYAPSTTNGDTTTLAATSEYAGASMSLSGNGTPNLVLSPGTFLGGTIDGEEKFYSFQLVSGVAQTFTLSNTGNGSSLTLQPLENFPQNPQFALSNDTCYGTALGPNGSCTFDVTFTPPTGCTSGTAYTQDFRVEGIKGFQFVLFYFDLEADSMCP